jgi:hypothetical protein
MGYVRFTCRKTDQMVSLRKKILLELYKSYVKSCTTIISQWKMVRLTLTGLHLCVMGSKSTRMRLWIEGRSLSELGWMPVIIWVESMVLCVRQWLIFQI